MRGGTEGTDWHWYHWLYIFWTNNKKKRFSHSLLSLISCSSYGGSQNFVFFVLHTEMPLVPEIHCASSRRIHQNFSNMLNINSRNGIGESVKETKQALSKMLWWNGRTQVDRASWEGVPASREEGSSMNSSYPSVSKELFKMPCLALHLIIPGENLCLGLCFRAAYIWYQRCGLAL